MGYYTSVIVLTWFVLGIMCILVRENARMKDGKKTALYLTYAIIAAAALTEWIGLQMEGKASVAPFALRVVKSLDYTLSPMAGGLIVTQFRNKKTRWRKILAYVLLGNTAFQVLCLFTGWMTVVDEQRHYSHGPLYFVYIIVYVLVTVLVVLEAIHYGRRFVRQNKISLYAILTLVIAGVALQELVPGVRTVYISLTVGMALLYIHNAEFTQQVAEDLILKQNILITQDALTGVSSRYAYSQTLKSLNATGKLPDRLTVFSIDINGLKEVNDTLGHEAGDELICGAAKCIVETLGQFGECFRTGGDEFVVLAYMDSSQTAEAMMRLSWQASKWEGKYIRELHLSVGSATASFHPSLTAEKLVSIADQEMYEEKAEYYRKTGIERRRTRLSESASSQ